MEVSSFQRVLIEGHDDKYFVFDRRRKSYLSKGKELLKQSKKSEANDCFRKCVDISPEMALAFIKVHRYPYQSIIIMVGEVSDQKKNKFDNS